MTRLSIIVPMLNLSGLARRALLSVDAAIDYLRRSPEGGSYECEVVVVDDGSTDGTRRVIEEHARGRDNYLVLMRDGPSNPGCARNAGVLASRGDLLFFLDGDDVFLKAHLRACILPLEHVPGVDYVKTGVALSDPVHPGWRGRIAGSLVQNLCVRRRCHEQVGGFPDLHLFRRHGEGFDHVLDVAGMYEDVFYNQVIGSLFGGWAVPDETVVYHRRPGNSFDRQYPKFLRPPGEHPGEADEDERSRIEICEALARIEIRRLRRLIRRAPT